MSNSQRGCEYELDPNDTKWEEQDIDPLVCLSEDDLNENGVWSCPHNAGSGENLCIFHQPVEKKESDEVTQAVLEATSDSLAQVDQSGAVKTKFIGAKFGTLNIDGETINSNSTIDFRYAIFGGEISANNAVFDGPVNFGGATFQSGVSFNDACFEDEVNFKSANFKEKSKFKSISSERSADFTYSVFDEWVSFRDSVFKSTIDFKKSEFRGDIAGTFIESTFECGLSFENVNVLGEIGFTDSKFKSDVSFRGSNFHSEISLIGMEVHGDFQLEFAEFNDSIDFTAKVDDEANDVEITGDVTNAHYRNFKRREDRFKLLQSASDDE